MTVEELIKALGLEAENAEKLKTFVETQSKASQAKITKLTGEVKQLKEDKKAAQTLQERLEAIADAFGVDVEAEDFDASIDAAKDELLKGKEGAESTQEAAQLKRDFAKLQRDHKKLQSTYETVEKTLGEERGKRQNELRMRSIIESMTKANFKHPELAARLIKEDVFVGDDDRVYYKGESGEELDLVEAVQTLAQKYPDYLADKQTGGAGSAAGGKAGDGKISYAERVLGQSSDANAAKSASYYFGEE